MATSKERPNTSMVSDRNVQYDCDKTVISCVEIELPIGAKGFVILCWIEMKSIGYKPMLCNMKNYNKHPIICKSIVRH